MAIIFRSFFLGAADGTFAACGGRLSLGVRNRFRSPPQPLALRPRCQQPFPPAVKGFSGVSRPPFGASGVSLVNEHVGPSPGSWWWLHCGSGMHAFVAEPLARYSACEEMRRFSARSAPAGNHGIAAVAGPMEIPADTAHLQPTTTPARQKPSALTGPPLAGPRQACSPWAQLSPGAGPIFFADISLPGGAMQITLKVPPRAL